MFTNKKNWSFFSLLIIGICFILFIYLLVKLFPFYQVVFKFIWTLLLPFFIACFIAYLLHPIVVKLQSYQIHKTVAILLIYGLFFGGIALLVYRAYPVIIYQLRDLNDYLPQLMTMYEEIIYNAYESTSFLPEAVHDQMDQFIRNMESRLESNVGKALNQFTKVFDFVVLITVIPVLVFYFLKDYDQMKQYVKKLLHTKYHERISHMIPDIDERLGSYLRGILLVSLFVSVMTFLAFHFLQLEYALLLAIIMGITNIIPYFGPIIGAVPALIIAVTVSPRMALYVIGLVLLIQLIESNFISPYIVGRSIQIHPVAIIFALLLGGQIAGVLGMILAVPTLTIGKEITRHLLVFNRSH